MNGADSFTLDGLPNGMADQGAACVGGDFITIPSNVHMLFQAYISISYNMYN